jgi:hypothetical protein
MHYRRYVPGSPSISCIYYYRLELYLGGNQNLALSAVIVRHIHVNIMVLGIPVDGRYTVAAVGVFTGAIADKVTVLG